MKTVWKVAVFAVATAPALLLAWANAPDIRLPEGSTADRLVIEKGKRLLHIYSGGNRLKSYPVSLGREPVGAKRRKGDNKTPEGHYQIIEHKRDSSFHRALRVSYPGEKDLATAREMGVEPGSDIMIHGIKNGLGWLGRIHRWFDWTAGCIAVTDPEMDELFAVVQNGAAVEIRK